MRICNQKAAKRAPIHEQKELRCSVAKSIEDALLRMARGNYVDHVIMQLSVKFKKNEKEKAKSGKLCYTGLVCYQYEEEINDGKLF